VLKDLPVRRPVDYDPHCSGKLIASVAYMPCCFIVWLSAVGEGFYMQVDGAAREEASVPACWLSQAAYAVLTLLLLFLLC